MKKTYVNPLLLYCAVDKDDIILTSGFSVDGNDTLVDYGIIGQGGI